MLTARVHVVLGGTDQATDTRTLPSAAVFLRHTPDSPVVNLVAKIRELTSKAVPDLDYERVSVMLVPVREQVSVPMEPTPEIPRIAARAAEWAAICLDRRGDRLFWRRSPDLRCWRFPCVMPCGSAKRRRTPRKISRRNAGTTGQVCTPRFFRTSSHGNLRCFGYAGLQRSLGLRCAGLSRSMAAFPV